MKYSTFHKTNSVYDLLKIYHLRPGFALTQEDGVIHIISPVKFIDLDLESGNLWATTNIGARSITDFGNLYLWGSTIPLSVCETRVTPRADWKIYPHSDDAGNSTKYNNSDGLTTLLPEDDIANIQYEGFCKIPTENDLNELVSLPHKFISINGVNGMAFCKLNETGVVKGNFSNILNSKHLLYIYDENHQNALSEWGTYGISETFVSANILEYLTKSEINALLTEYLPGYNGTVNIDTMLFKNEQHTELAISGIDYSCGSFPNTFNEDTMLFIPAAGSVTGEFDGDDEESGFEVLNQNLKGNIWSSDRSSQGGGHSKIFSSYFLKSLGTRRNCGYSVRPICVLHTGKTILYLNNGNEIILRDSVITEDMIYDYDSVIERVEIGKNVTNIAEYAFDDCINLTSVTIPNSVIRIERSAFENCKKLSSITTPNSVRYIGECAFSNCDNLQSATILSGSIDYEAFYDCSSLASVHIGSGVTSMSGNVFSNCKNLLIVTIDNNIDKLDDWTFEHCEKLSSINIPASVTSIGYGAFSNCESLTSIIIPNNVTIIKTCAFEFSGLTSVEIPNSVTTIENEAFDRCNNLVNVSIGNSVTSIGQHAFRDCNLTSITCTNTIPPTIQSGTFSNIQSTCNVYVPSGYKSAYENADYWEDFTHIYEL